MVMGGRKKEKWFIKRSVMSSLRQRRFDHLHLILSSFFPTNSFPRTIMENPRDEIIGVVTRITAAASPDAQKYAMLTYFTQDVGFKHPLCTVRPGPNSRLKLMGVYQYVVCRNQC